MSNDSNSIERKQRSDKGGMHVPMSRERKEKFLAALRESGSFRDAATAATPTGTPGDGCYGQTSFRREMQIDPEFKQAVEEARAIAIGKLEKELTRRAFIPDRRPIADRLGNIVATAESWQAANALALQVLAKLSPEEWTPAQKRTIDTKITHVGQNSHSGLGFVITPQLTSHLNDDEKKALSDLMRKMVECEEEAAEQRKKQLPAPGDETETP
jgi:hypothetical protein